MDIQIGGPEKFGDKKHRIVLKLINKDLPKTCENFRALCTGELDKTCSTKGDKFGEGSLNS